MKRKSKKQSGNNKMITAVYNSVTQFWGAINEKPTNAGFWESSKRESNSKGTKTYEEATELLLKGDRATADKVLRDVAAIKRLINKQAKRWRVETGVVGFAPNVPNYLAGVPRSMITAKPADRKDKVVNVVYNFAAPYFVTKEELTTAVINLAGAVCALEAGGARVNVFAQFAAENGSDKLGLFVKVKNASQPMDTLKMIYPLGHPSMLRRHALRWVETANGIPTSFASDYGQAVTLGTAGNIAAAAGVKCDRVIDYSIASNNDYKALAKMIDTGVII